MLEIEPARIAQLGTNYPTIARVSGSLAGQGGRATGDPAAPATRQRFVESDHSLEAFVLVIVGLVPFPRGSMSPYWTPLDSTCWRIPRNNWVPTDDPETRPRFKTNPSQAWLVRDLRRKLLAAAWPTCKAHSDGDRLLFILPR